MSGFGRGAFKNNRGKSNRGDFGGGHVEQNPHQNQNMNQNNFNSQRTFRGNNQRNVWGNQHNPNPNNNKSGFGGNNQGGFGGNRNYQNNTNNQNRGSWRGGRGGHSNSSTRNQTQNPHFCVHYATKDCRNGANCTFAHSLATSAYAKFAHNAPISALSCVDATVFTGDLSGQLSVWNTTLGPYLDSTAGRDGATKIKVEPKNQGMVGSGITALYATHLATFNSTMCFVGLDNGGAKVVSLSGDTVEVPAPGVADPVKAMTTVNGNILVVGHASGVLRFWQLGSPVSLVYEMPNNSPVNCMMSITVDDGVAPLIAVGGLNFVVILQLTDEGIKPVINHTCNDLVTGLLSFEGCVVASLSKGDLIVLTSTGDVFNSRVGGQGSVTCMEGILGSSGNAFVVVGRDGGFVNFLSLPDLQNVGGLKLLGGSVTGVKILHSSEPYFVATAVTGEMGIYQLMGL